MKNDWEKVFDEFYNKNKEGGSSRWLVGPHTVKIFIAQEIKKSENRKRDLIYKILLTAAEEFKNRGYLNYGVSIEEVVRQIKEKV